MNIFNKTWKKITAALVIPTALAAGVVALNQPTAVDPVAALQIIPTASSTYKTVLEFPGIPPGEDLWLDNSNPAHPVYRGKVHKELWIDAGVVENSKTMRDISTSTKATVKVPVFEKLTQPR